MPERLEIEALTRQAFAPFGDVIETAGVQGALINDGAAARFADLAEIDVCEEGGRPSVSIFRARPRSLPLTVEVLERHPLGSQAFVPLSRAPFLVLAAQGDLGDSPRLRAFRTNGAQGVNIRRGVWHHPLLALDEESEFLVIDRGGPGENLELGRLPAPILVGSEQ